MAAFVLGMVVLGGAQNLNVFTIAIISAGAISVVAAGELLLDFVGLTAIPARGPAAILLGASATNLFLLAGTLVVQTAAGHLFVVWIVLILAASFLRRTGMTQAKAPNLFDGFALLCMAMLVGFWARGAAAAIPALQSGAPLPIWTDYYIHATTIAQFGDPLSAHRGSMVLADQPWVFYHYSTFMTAAALGGVLNLPSLGLATAAQLPIGLLLGLIGAYALATALADRRAGAIVIAFLTLIPDPSTYGFSNGYFGFFWMLFTSPGSGYALGSAALSLIFFLEWRRTGARNAVIMALIIAAVMFQERAQIFLWFAIAIALALIATLDVVRKRQSVIVWSVLGAATITSAVLLFVPPVRALWNSVTAVSSFLDVAHMSMHPIAYEGVYDQITRRLGQPAAIVIGTAILAPIASGVFTVAAPVALIASRRRVVPQPLDAFPFLVLFAFFFCVWFSPIPPGGDFGEYKQRPFVLLYEVAAVWTAAWICRLFRPWEEGKDERLGALGLIFTVAASLSLGLITGYRPARPNMEVGKMFYPASLDPGLVEAAAYVRARSSAKDTVALAPPEPDAVLTDRATEFVSLTDVPSYLARANVNVNQEGERRDILVDRLARMKKVQAAASWSDAAEQLRSMPVTWYVWIGKSGPSFDPDRTRANFVCDAVSVYRVNDDSSAAQPQLSCRP